ncbi:carboxypeptidase-like regulatory domain-containing protein [Halalkalibaculum sp. DA384]|uniref:TonB-dependent receptor n=1 Tax=Halalkalibaculum sp. DA384 TaxID=3373606 RepID=UPI0037548C92
MLLYKFSSVEAQMRTKGINLIRIVFSILLLAAFVVPVTLHAQNSGVLSGYVTDAQTGDPLPGATVRLEGTERGAATDTNGYFTIEKVAPRSYTVTASFVGYQSVTRYNVVVNSGNNPDINFALEPSVNELGEISVEPDPYDQPPENPLSRQELSQVQIASYPGGNNDIAKVAQSLPGVSGSVGGFRNDVIIRGGAPSENVYYLDGIEIPVINHFATQGSAGGPVGLLNVSFFEGVSLSTSSFPARYDDVLSGVLQFDQRNGNARHYGANIRVGASETAFTVEGPLLKSEEESYANTTFIASVRRSYLQLLFQLIDLPFLPDYWDYQYKLNHKIDNFNELTITGVGAIDDFRINKPDNITAEQQATLDQVPIIKQWSSTGGISWRHRFRNTDGYLRTTLSSSAFDNNFRQYRDNENKDGLIQSTQSREWSTTLRSEYNRFIENWSISAGLMLENNQYTTQSFRSFDDVRFDTDLDFLRYGAYGQVTREWKNNRFSTSLGIRADGNTFTDDGNKLWRTLSPRLAVSYAIDAHSRWEINASAGRYFKIPPTTILGFQQNNSFVNRNADYIRSDHLVAGLSFTPRKSTQLSVEGFYKRYEAYPVSRSDSVSLANLGADFDIFGNEAILSTGAGRAYGIELTYQQKLISNFYGLLAYTLYWSEFTGFEKNRFLPSRWDNRHLLTFTGGYQLPRNWEIGGRLRILGGAPYPVLKRDASEETYPNLVFDYSTLGEQRLDLFNALDLRIDKKWNFNRWALNLYLEISNVLASNIPNPPEYGLERNADGTPVQPRQIIEIEELDNSSRRPTLGIVIDI